MNQQKSKLLLMALLIFLGGAACGGFGAASVSMGMPNGDEEFHGGGKWMRDPKKFAEHIKEKLESKLELSPTQSQQLATILDKSVADSEEVHKKMREEREARRAAMNKEIEGILDDKQKVKFAELREKFKKKREKYRERYQHSRDEQ